VNPGRRIGAVEPQGRQRAAHEFVYLGFRKAPQVADVQKNLKPGSNVLRVLNGDQVSLVFLR
jgi:hypothetical protein